MFLLHRKRRLGLKKQTAAHNIHMSSSLEVYKSVVTWEYQGENKRGNRLIMNVELLCKVLSTLSFYSLLMFF